MKKIFLGSFTVIGLIVGFYIIYGLFKPLPTGLSYEGNVHRVEDVEFVYDLTYKKDGKVVHDQNIFNRTLQLIDEADEFIVFDMFLFNEKHDENKEYPPIANKLTNKLIEKKRQNPKMSITFITDEINTTYRSHESPHLEKMKQNGIDVILTNLTPLRDSNPLYSGPWRAFLKWSGKEGKGWVTNPFDEDAPDITLRSYLKMLNFKGNHRKVLITDKRVMVSSANIHDASAYNSNIAFVVKGNIIQDALNSEKAVARFSSNSKLPSVSRQKEEIGNIEVQLLTEGQTRQELIQSVKQASRGDSIFLGMFYLSESEVVEQLVDASKRGVSVHLTLDPNKKIFGRENIGIPNRPVAAEIKETGGQNIKIKWYNTGEEQYHTKLILIKGKQKSIIIGGSANFTRRNLNDFNLDTSLKIVTPTDSEIYQDVFNYFTRIWNNRDGQYTLNEEEFLENYPFYKRVIFRLQKHTGITTF